MRPGLARPVSSRRYYLYVHTHLNISGRSLRGGGLGGLGGEEARGARGLTIEGGIAHESRRNGRPQPLFDPYSRDDETKDCPPSRSIGQWG